MPHFPALLISLIGFLVPSAGCNVYSLDGAAVRFIRGFLMKSGSEHTLLNLPPPLTSTLFPAWRGNWESGEKEGTRDNCELENAQGRIRTVMEFQTS